MQRPSDYNNPHSRRWLHFRGNRPRMQASKPPGSLPGCSSLVKLFRSCRRRSPMEAVCVPLCGNSGGPPCSGNAKRPQRSPVRWLRCACALRCSWSASEYCTVRNNHYTHTHHMEKPPTPIKTYNHVQKPEQAVPLVGYFHFMILYTKTPPHFKGNIVHLTLFDSSVFIWYL